jgi:hypothetical protein
MTNLVETEDITQKFAESMILVHLKCHRYGSEKTDKEQTKKLRGDLGIKSSLKTHTVKKETLPIKDSMKAVETYDNTQIWGVVRKFGAPYGDSTYVIPAAKYLEFMAEMRRVFAGRADLIKTVGETYTLLVEAAKVTLATDFKANEYPKLEDVLRKYHVTFEVTPVAHPSRLKLSVMSEAAEAIQQAVNETFAEKTSKLAPYLKETLLKPLAAVSNTCQRVLSDKPGVRVHDSVFENLHEATEQAKNLNMLNDEQVDNAIFQIEQTIPRHSGGIKEDKQLCQRVLSDCHTVMESLDGTPPEMDELQPCDPEPLKSDAGDPFPEITFADNPPSESPYSVGLQEIVGKSSIVKEVVEDIGLECVEVKLAPNPSLADLTPSEPINSELLAKLGWV